MNGATSPRRRQHLAQLDRLCFFGCSERATEKAIAEYEKAQAGAVSVAGVPPGRCREMMMGNLRKSR